MRASPEFQRLVADLARDARTESAPRRGRSRAHECTADAVRLDCALFAVQRAAFARERYPDLARPRDRLPRLCASSPRTRRDSSQRSTAISVIAPRTRRGSPSSTSSPRRSRHALRASAALDAAAARRDAAAPACRGARASMRQPLGCRRHHQPVELPGAAGARARDRRARRRQPRAAEAVGADAARRRRCCRSWSRGVSRKTSLPS